LRATFNFANAFQIPVQHGAVAVAQLALQLLGAIQDQVQDAVGLA
jgi:hypothetical protein